MKIGILQTGHAPATVIPAVGDYDTLFTRFLARDGVEFTTFAVVDGVFPQNLDLMDGWLITGSKYGAYDNLPWIARLEELIRWIYASGKPLVGICFGHQMIAQALGGKVEKYEGGWSVGVVDYQRLNQDTDNATDGSGAAQPTANQKLVAWHQDQVVSLPPDAEIIGTNAQCRYAMLRYGDKALSFQPHPEFSQEFYQALFAARADILPEETKQTTTTPQEAELSRLGIAEEIHTFFAQNCRKS